MSADLRASLTRLNASMNEVSKSMDRVFLDMNSVFADIDKTFRDIESSQPKTMPIRFQYGDKVFVVDSAGKITVMPARKPTPFERFRRMFS